MIRPLLFLALVACAPANAVNVVQAAVQADPHAHVHTDLRGTVTSIEAVRDQVQTLDGKALKEAQDASAVLMQNCPYNRASFQLPFVMQQVAHKYDAEFQDERIQDDWRRFQRGLDAHAETLVLLSGGELTKPGKKDYLAQVDAQFIATRGDLAKSSDPLGETQEFMRLIPDLVDAYDDETKAKIDAATPVLAMATGDQWTLKAQLIGWRSAIEKIEPFVTDPEMSNDLLNIKVAIAYYLGQFC